jgi:hypothetical protein
MFIEFELNNEEEEEEAIISPKDKKLPKLDVFNLNQ